MTYPACFKDHESFAEWRRLARASHLHAASSICVDCTPEYKTKMMIEDRCSEPEIVFKRNEEGEVVGELPFDRIRFIKSGRSKWGDGYKIFQMKLINEA